MLKLILTLQLVLEYVNEIHLAFRLVVLRPKRHYEFNLKQSCILQLRKWLEYLKIAHVFSSIFRFSAIGNRKYYIQHFFIWKLKTFEVGNVANWILRNLKLEVKVILILYSFVEIIFQICEFQFWILESGKISIFNCNVYWFIGFPIFRNQLSRIKNVR